MRSILDMLFSLRCQFCNFHYVFDIPTIDFSEIGHLRYVAGIFGLTMVVQAVVLLHVHPCRWSTICAMLLGLGHCFLGLANRGRYRSLQARAEATYSYQRIKILDR